MNGHRGGSATCGATRGATSRTTCATLCLRVHDLKHDELACRVLVSERDDRPFVTAQSDGEDVDTRVEERDELAVRRLPQSDGSVARSRHHHLVIARDRTAPDLQQKQHQVSPLGSTIGKSDIRREVTVSPGLTLIVFTVENYFGKFLGVTGDDCNDEAVLRKGAML